MVAAARTIPIANASTKDNSRTSFRILIAIIASPVLS
jgi:hypothetical protein